jgi:hypothetical protein
MGCVVRRFAFYSSAPGGTRTPNPRFRSRKPTRRKCQVAQEFSDSRLPGVPVLVPTCFSSCLTPKQRAIKHLSLVNRRVGNGVDGCPPPANSEIPIRQSLSIANCLDNWQFVMARQTTRANLKKRLDLDNGIVRSVISNAAYRIVLLVNVA